MIKVESNGIGAEITFKGSLPILCTELSSIIRGFRETASKSLGEEMAEKLLDDVIRTSKLSRDEIKKEVKKSKRELVDRLLKDLIDEIEEDDDDDTERADS